MVSYYDKLLVVIPLAIGIGAAASLHDAVSLPQGLAAGSLVSTLVLYEAIFRNPPVESTPANVTATIVTGLGWVLATVLYYA